MNIFSNLKSEFQSLMVMQNSILDTFKDYKTLHRQTRSVLPIIGKAMNRI